MPRIPCLPWKATPAAGVDPSTQPSSRRLNFFRFTAQRREVKRKLLGEEITKGLFVRSDELVATDSFVARSVGQAPTWRAVLVGLLLCAVPFATFLSLFSTLGYGVEWHLTARRHPASISRIGYGILLVVAIAWLSQVSRRLRWISAPLSLLFLVGLLAVTISNQRANPAWPFCLLVLSLPMWLLAAKRVLEWMLSNHFETFFLFSVARQALAAICAALVVWFFAIYGPLLFRHGALPAEVARISAAIECDSEAEDGCILAYVLLINPLLAALICYLYSVLAYSLADAGTPVERVLARTLAALTAVIWVAFQIAGASLHFTEVVTVAALAGIAGAFGSLLVYSSMILDDIMTGKSLGTDASSVKLAIGNLQVARTVNRKASSLLKQLGQSYGEWVFAFLFVSPAPLLVAAYLALDVMRGLVCGTRVEPRAVTVLKELALANWSSVFPKAVVLATIYMTINVGVKLGMMLLLSWLIGQLQGLPLALVLGTYLVAGLVLSMIPAVPGSTVFIAGGIIITSASRERFGYFGGILLATVTSYVLKLCAIFVQQEVIGKFLGRSPSVRQLIGVNSLQVRSIKKILSQPGLPPFKVFVLVGGPDWPTSVLAGILRCNVWSCLLGSLPVLLFIFPPCTMGALTLPNPPMDAEQQKAVLLFSALMGLVPLLSAMYAIDQTMSRHAEELLAQPADEEVVALEQEQSKQAALERLAVSWWRHVEPPSVRFADDAKSAQLSEYQVEGGLEPLPLVARALLVVAWLSAWGVVGLVSIFDDGCYVDFAITDSIALKLGGNALNAVYPLGWLAFALQAIALIALNLFRRWGTREAARIAPRLRKVATDAGREFAHTNSTGVPAAAVK